VYNIIKSLKITNKGGKNMTNEMIVLYTIAISLGLLSAFCSLAEASIVALTEISIQKYANSNEKLFKKLKKFVENKDKFLSAIIMLNTLVNIGGSMFVGSIAINLYSAEDYSIFLGTLTIAMLLFSEIKPKIYAAQNPENILKIIGTPIIVFTTILSPFVNMVNGFLNNSSKNEKDKMQVEELMHLLTTAKKTGIIRNEEEKIMKNIIDLKAKTADILIEEENIVSMNVGDKIIDKKDDLIDCKYRRIILTNDEGKPVGMFFRAKALTKIIKEDADIPFSKIMHPVPIVDLNTDVTTLARKLQKSGAHISVVADEEGNVKGIISLSDVKGLIFS
jgi:CBS domain containing-hemolysin-like protein